MSRKKIIIIGGGPSGLIAAHTLKENFDVTIIEKEKAVGQKFLVAGKGGFNLTNSATGKSLFQKYYPESFLDNALTEFDSEALRVWLKNLGIDTYVGTSGRVFPVEGTMPVEVLSSIKNSLLKSGVEIKLKHSFKKFVTENRIEVEHNNSTTNLEADYFIFGLGGASWSKTGSDGKWVKAFNNFRIRTLPFLASNCGVNIEWPKQIINHHLGKPLKNITLSCGKKNQTGEVVLTDYGIEGNALYPIIPEVRSNLISESSACIFIDFKPNNSLDDLLKKIKKVSSKDYSKLFNLNTVSMALIKAFTEKDEFLSPTSFIKNIKRLVLPVNSLRPIEEAISTVGGIPIDELNEDFSLKKIPNIFTVGEMVNWDAPTGGYLLQGCFSTGYYASVSILKKEGLINR